jgi:hypothetical protein
MACTSKLLEGYGYKVAPGKNSGYRLVAKTQKFKTVVLVRFVAVIL